MKHLFIVISVVVVSLTACTDDGSATKAKEKEATVFDSQLNALDTTRNIENVLQQSADQRQNNLDVE